MSLTVAFKSAQAGIAQAEKKIAVVASNINNADRPGYTRKSLQSDFFFNGLTSLPIGGKVVQSVLNPLLVKQVIAQSTDAEHFKAMSTYLGDYGQAFGSTGEGATNIETTIDTLLSTLHVLEANAGDSAAKAKVISTAQSVASNLNDLTQTLQNGRLRANNEIALSVGSINENLKAIADLNKEIATAEATGSGSADLEDTRSNALQSLAQQLGIQYFVNDQNQAIVYATGGSSLVSGTGYATLAYDPVGVVSPNTVYPGGFNPITLNGADITTTLQTGKLGALLDLRDTTLPGEQAKLDELASTLKTTVNRVLSRGSAYPPLSTITGTQVVNSGTAFSGTGTFRVAVTNASGIVQNYTDINLSTLSPATVGGLMTALNGISGVTASIDASGHMLVSASGSNRISVNPLTSSVGGKNASEFFGFNDLFTNVGTTAATFSVNSNLLGNFSGLAIGTLSASGSLAAGDAGITSGDSSVATALIDAMKTAQNFSSAGNFSARSSTLSNYAGAIISDVATGAAAAQQKADTAGAAYSYLSSTLSNDTGVNIDEESANLTVLQTAYQANAQIISTIRDLFSTLINAVS